MEIEMDHEQAMARIRAEIMAPDWRLNRRRAEGLRVALAAVDPGVVNGRKSFLYLLEMARVALAYQEKYGEAAPPMVLDFLKQALAQVIAVVEEDDLSEEQGSEIFNKVHRSFLVLKRQLARPEVSRS